MDRMRMIRFAPSLLIHPFLLLLSRSLFPDQGHLCPPSSFRLVFTLTFPFPPASSRPLLANASLLPVLLKTLSSSSSCCHRDGPRLPLFSRRVLPLSIPDLGAVTALGARAWWYGGGGVTASRAAHAPQPPSALWPQVPTVACHSARWPESEGRASHPADGLKCAQGQAAWPGLWPPTRSRGSHEATNSPAYPA